MRGNRLFKTLDFVLGITLNVVLGAFVRRHPDGGHRSGEPVRRILAVKLAAVGDGVLLIPSVRALRRRFPLAEIVFLGTNLTVPLLNLFPEYVNRCITLDLANILRRPFYWIRIIRELRSLRCDCAYDFEQWSRITPLILAVAGIRARAGFRTAGQYRHYLFTRSVEHRSSSHEVDNFLALAEAGDGGNDSRLLEIRVRDESVKKVRGMLHEYSWNEDIPLIVLHPGCGRHGFPREWPPENYHRLATFLSQHRRLFFAVSGTREESHVMEEVVRSGSNLYGSCSFDQQSDFIALFSLSSLVVSGNTGAMHLAAALQVPQIALHGPTDVRRWGPLNPNAVVIQSSCPDCPCLNLGFEYHRSDGYCMRQIPVDEVYHVSLQLLANKISTHSS